MKALKNEKVDSRLIADLVARIGKRKIIVMMGGLSAEREISLLTGQAMLKVLRSLKLNVKGLDIKSKDDVLSLVKQKPAVVVNALHGPGGEDGVVQGILEWFGISFTGSGVLSSALAMNKHLCKQILKSAGLPTAPWILVLPGSSIPKKLKLPVVIKPNQQGSAIGVSIVRDKKTILPALEQARQYGEEILVEQYLPGTEISVGVLHGRALPVIEIVPKKEFYDYEAKYVEGMSEHIIPARLTVTQTRKVQEMAIRTAEVLGCHGTPRIDMIVSPAGKINILEVNTLPGMTATSLLPDAAQHAGISFTDLVLRLILDAWGETL